jgi:hypothetical protein
MTVAFSDWVAQQRARGWQVEHGLPSRGGWPFAARVSVPGIRIAGWTPALPRGFVWEAGQLDLTITTPRLDRLVLAAQGRQMISGGALSVPFSAARLEAVAILGPGPQPVEFLLDGLHAQLPDGALTARSLRGVLLPGGRDAEPSLGLQVEARQVGLPALPAVAAFGRDVEHAALDAVLTGPPPPPLPLSPRERAEAWRAGGAVLDLRRVALRWGALAGDLRMALQLDAALQPVGSGALAVDDPSAALAALAAARIIAPNAAAAAGAVVAMVARTPRDGGPPRVELPVAMANGTVTVARIPVAQLRPIDWTSEPPPLR